MSINYRQLRIEMERNGDAIYRKVKPVMLAEFNDRKGILLAEFDANPVTRELQAGPDAVSDVVNTMNGGNLYSLIGFEAGENPTAVVREILEKDLRLNQSQISREVHANTITFKTPVRMPTLDSFHQRVAQALPLAWTSRSFTDLLERGITGFPQYLFDNLRNFGGKSRSGTAIQLPHNIRAGSTRRVPYVSAILASFRRLIAGRGL